MSSSIPGSTRHSAKQCLLHPVENFESLLGQSVDHLLAERPRYAHAARRSVLGRSWPAICEQLVNHYHATRTESHGRVKEVRSA